MKLLKLTYLVLPMALISSCNKQNSETTLVVPESLPGTVLSVHKVPQATAFKMSGDYSNYVAVTFDANGRLLYYPAPGDITNYSKPIDLGNGWWLNNQGLSANSVFTSWTFDEYAALKNTPSVDEIKASILLNARVTDICTLPYKVGDTGSHIDDIKYYLSTKE
jgi:hypothetical protein